MTEEEKTSKAEQILALLIDLYPEFASPRLTKEEAMKPREALISIGPTFLRPEDFHFENAFLVNGVEICKIDKERMDDTRALKGM
jgi:hypothetical protein